MAKKSNTIKNKAIYFIIFAFLFIFPAVSDVKDFSNNQSYTAPSVVSYSISSFNVNAEVTKYNEFKIQETITILPNQEMRGIVRGIPLYQKVSFKEGKKEYNINHKTNIYNIKVDDEPFSSYKEEGYAYIQIGKETEYFSHSKTYTISYVLNFGDDRIAEFDQIYFNVIGTDWDAKISNASFTITMPKALPENKQMFVYSGKYGSTDEQIVSVEADLKTFTYAHSTSLNKFNGLTVRVLLDKDYFDFSLQQSIAKIVSWIIFVIALSLSIGFGIKLFKTKKHIVTPVIMFNSPNDLPPSELGYIIDGKVDNQDISSLIVYWAEKGFLKIKEDNKKFTLIKLKDMESGESYEQSIFNTIFATSEEVKFEQVGESIYPEIVKAKEEITNKHQSTHFNIKNKNSKYFFAFLASFIVTAIATIILKVTIQPYLRLVVGVLGFLSLVISYFVIAKDNLKFKKKMDFKERTLLYLLPVLCVWIVMSALSFNLYYDKLFLSIFAIIPASLIMLVAIKLETRKKEGLEIFGQVLGFKQFISHTEKDRIKMLAKENPQMFYSVLPYAYVLGVSDEWINKFEAIALAPPSWYESSAQITVFDYLVMKSIFRSIMFSSMTNMIHRPSMNADNKHTGGGFGGGGGGFTGGGFGGGGGRGW